MNLLPRIFCRPNLFCPCIWQGRGFAVGRPVSTSLFDTVSALQLRPSPSLRALVEGRPFIAHRVFPYIQKKNWTAGQRNVSAGYFVLLAMWRLNTSSITTTWGTRTTRFEESELSFALSSAMPRVTISKADPQHQVSRSSLSENRPVRNQSSSGVKRCNDSQRRPGH